MNKRARILILDDDAGSALLQSRAIERAGNHALTAHTAQEAFKLLEQSPVDLVTVDYRLSGEINGLGFCARLRASGIRVPVIMVSGSSDERTVVQALRMGIQDFLLKDTQFLERLPPAVASALARAELEQQLEKGVDRGMDLQAGMVLVLDNDEATARAQMRELERGGYSVKTARTPEEAETIIRNFSVGMLILDQRLSNEQLGSDIYKRFRSYGYDIPAVLVTAYSDTATAAEALRAGIRDYVEKTPGYSAELTKVVERVFERVHLERLAAESNARLAAIVSSAMDAIIAVELNGQITIFNDAAENTFGCDAASAIGSSIERFLPDLFTLSAAGNVQLTQTSHVELDGRRANGTLVPLEVSAVETSIASRKFYTVIARDVTTRREAQLALLHANDELRRLNSDLEQFAYSTSHDLKEPLRNIAIYTQMLQRHLSTELDSDAARFLSLILEGTRRMERLLEDLLTYTQILNVGHDLTANPPLVESSAVVDSVLNGLGPMLKDTGAVVTTGELPEVPILEIHLHQIFQNLISNAIKYRKKESPRVHITAARERDHWLFAVKDNGIGIEPQFHERIFGLFKRLHSRDQYPGSGVGLALCKRIVERYGGRIWVESQCGAGSTFFFTVKSRDLQQGDGRPDGVRPGAHPAS